MGLAIAFPPSKMGSPFPSTIDDTHILGKLGSAMTLVLFDLNQQKVLVKHLLGCPSSSE